MFGFNRKSLSPIEKERWLDEERGRKADPSWKEKAMTFIERINRLPIHKFTDYESYMRAGSERVWASFRACHITAGVLVKTKFHLVGKDNQEIKKPDPNLSELLVQPNPFDSWEELIYVWTHHMKLTGNAYWLKDEMDGRGRPLHLYPLMPQNMWVIPDVATKVAGYRYYVNGRYIDFLPEDIIHFRRPHPRDSIMGIGDIEPGQALFNDQINRDTYNEKFIENGASPSGILTKDEAEEDPTEWAKFKAFWDKTYGGKKNIGKTAFLNGKWSYHQLGLSSQQMQNIEKEKMSIQNIFLAHGVPLSVAGIDKASNLATARQDDINFRKYECVPLIDTLIGKLNSNGGIIRPFGNGLTLSYSLSGLIDVATVMADYGPLFSNGGLTINELRVLAGLPETDNPLHNQYFLTAGLVPLEMAGMTETPPPEELEKIVLGLTRGGTKKNRRK